MDKGLEELTVIETIRSLLSIIMFFLMLFLATPLILLILILTLGRGTNFIIEQIAPIIVQPVYWVAGIKFEKIYHTNHNPVPAVFIINHSSTLDILTILALGLPRVRFVAKWQLQYNPIFFLLGRITGQVFIRREQSDKAVETLKKAVARIKKQELSVMLAPEGSRKHEGIIGKFKKGPFRMAIDLGYPIVPIYFEGNRTLSSGGFLLTKSGRLRAHFHEPIQPSQWDPGNFEAEIENVRNKYLRWVEKYEGK